MRDGENIRAVEALNIDWIGFIFYPHSKRYVGDQLTLLPKRAKRVGVFVNQSMETVLEKVGEYWLDIVQLHGDESPEFCKQLGQHDNIQVMKAFGIADNLPFEKVATYEGTCDFYLYDTHTSEYGGSGRQFDWDILQYHRGNTPFLLSGGIGPDDVQAIKEYDNPMCVGIDINSKFELSPALKDIQSIEQFIKSLKQ